MKLVSFTEFCEMPNGTIFQEYASHCLDQLMIRGPVLRNDQNEPIDFLEACLTPSCPSGNYFSDTAKYDPEKDYIVMPIGFERWGMADTEAQFLVWNEGDTKILANWLTSPNTALEGINAGPHTIIEVPNV